MMDKYERAALRERWKKQREEMGIVVVTTNEISLCQPCSLSGSGKWAPQKADKGPVATRIEAKKAARYELIKRAATRQQDARNDLEKALAEIALPADMGRFRTAQKWNTSTEDFDVSRACLLAEKLSAEEY